MRLLFAGGVTGGHIAPGVALAERVLEDEPGSEVLFASVANATEEQMVARRGLPLVRVSRRPSGLASTAAAAVGAWVRSRRLLASFRPDAVVGLGSGGSLGGALAAVAARRPLVLLEGNVVPGRATRRLARWAAAVCCQWEPTVRTLGPRARHTGSPVREEITAARDLAKADAKLALGLEPARPAILVMGGSQGARPLNRALLEVAPRLAHEGIQLVHLAGEEDAPKLTEAYRTAGVRAHVSGFLGVMHLAYAAADVAVARAGAATLAELAAAGVPAILVPYPHAKDDHQRANARAAAEESWAVVVDPAEWNAETAAALLRRITAERRPLEAMRDRALSAARPRAAEDVLNTVRELCPREAELSPAMQADARS